MVYARTLGERTLNFQVSGMLWRNSLIMVDRETDTLWSHVTGEALQGRLEGRRLETVPSVHTSWREWRAAHPDTDVLKKSSAVGSSHYQSYFDDPDRTGLFRSQWLAERMPGKALVWGATVGPHAVAVTGDALAGGPVTVDLGGTPVALHRGEDGGVRGWVARAGGVELKLRTGDGAVTDAGTGSRWDLTRGVAVAGELTGTELESVTVTKVFWFAWSSFYPNTLVR